MITEILQATTLEVLGYNLVGTIATLVYLGLMRLRRKNRWKRLVIAESKTGEWDWFYPSIEGKKDYIKLVRFANDDSELESLHMTKESWEDLVQLIRRIT
jgi:hypothetical protein